MAINPMMLMQLKNKLSAFNSRHPKLKKFFANVFGQIETGDVLEISVTKADGNKVRTNIKITPEDTELLKELTSLISQGK